jgi:hypothetical protein
MTRMESTQVLDRLDSMIDELLAESGVSASSLATILMAARDSVADGYHVALARRVWDASNAIKDNHDSNLGFSLSTQEAAGID